MPSLIGLPPWSEVSARRAAHIARVVGLLDEWASAMALPAEEHRRWLSAGWLHDALRDASHAAQRALAPDAEGPPVLWHGPAAASMAAQHGVHDAGLLSAVRWHSIGDADWDACGDALFCADYLEPGRTFDVDARAALRSRFPEAPDQVLREVVRARLRYALREQFALHPRTAALWNRALGPAAAWDA